MSIPKLSIEQLLKAFSVDTVDKLIVAKTKTKQVKDSPGVTIGHRVKMTADQCKKLCEASNFEYKIGYENRVIERIVTTEACDRYGDIIRAKGVDLTNYKKNPVVLFSHNHAGLPVGRSLKEWLDKEIMGWRSWDLYFDNELDTSGVSDLVFRMVSSGAMSGGSIGFIPLEWKDDHDADERSAIGLGKYGVEFLKIEKLEHSACSIPANQEALAKSLKSVDKNILVTNDLDCMEKKCLLDGELIEVFRKELFGNAKKTFPTFSFDENTDVPDLSTEKSEEYEIVEKDVVLRPYPNEHACRLAEPSKFDEFRRTKRKHDGKEYNVIMGKYKDKDEWADQAYRYPKDTWTEDEARSHCKDHKGIKFEPAKSEENFSVGAQHITLDLGDTFKELCEISQTIKTFTAMLEKIEKSFESKFEKLMTIAERSVSASEQRMTVDLYDNDFKDILKL